MNACVRDKIGLCWQLNVGMIAKCKRYQTKRWLLVERTSTSGKNVLKRGTELLNRLLNTSFAAVFVFTANDGAAKNTTHDGNLVSYHTLTLFVYCCSYQRTSFSRKTAVHEECLLPERRFPTAEQYSWQQCGWCRTLSRKHKRWLVENGAGALWWMVCPYPRWWCRLRTSSLGWTHAAAKFKEHQHNQVCLYLSA